MRANSSYSFSLKRTSLQGLALAAALMVAACGGGKKEADADSAKAPVKGKDGKEVAAAPVPETPYAAVSSGKVDIEGGLVDVASRRGGIIREVFVQEGDEVKKGQVLARQEDEEARLARDRVAAELRQAEAQIPLLEIQLATARREATRLSALASGNIVAQQRLDEANDAVSRGQASLAAQRATLGAIRARLAESGYEVEQHVVRAPADGRIVRRFANPGVGASTLNVTPLFQLQPRTNRIVRAEVEERSLNAIHIGQMVEIVPEADQALKFDGKVLRIAEVMGARKLRSDDPAERVDERVVEVVIDARSADVLVGQRMLVKFLKKDAPASPAAIAQNAAAK